MVAIALRVRTIEVEHQNQVLDWVKNCGHVGAYFLVLEHEDTNAHVQGYLMCDSDLKSMRNRFVYHFKHLVDSYKVGNGFYSMKEIADTSEDRERYLQYLCKGDELGQGPVMVGYHGIQFTEDYISDKHKAYWAEHKSIAKKKKKGEDAPYEKAWKRCVKQKIRGSEREKIAEVLVEEYRDAAKPFNYHQLRAYVNLFQLRLGGADELKEAVSIIARQI